MPLLAGVLEVQSAYTDSALSLATVQLCELSCPADYTPAESHLLRQLARAQRTAEQSAG